MRSSSASRAERSWRCAFSATAITCLWAHGCAADVAASRGEPVARTVQAVVYGEDDRIEVGDVRDPRLQALARSNVVALMRRATVAIEDGRVTLDAPTLAEGHRLCPEVRFVDQPAAAFCSGILVDAQTVLTAGHCARRVPCSETLYVADYANDGGADAPELQPDDVYACETVLVRELSPVDAIERFDFAWVRLDRPIERALQPIDFRPWEHELQSAEALTVVGFSGGVPMKVSTGNRVADPRLATLDYFSMNADVFAADSGAPVFDSELRLVGVNARGNSDYVDSERGCSVVQQLPDTAEAAGEQASYAFGALEAWCEVEPSSAICGGDEPSPRAAGCAAGGSPRPNARSWVGLGVVLPILLIRLGRSWRQPRRVIANR